MPPHPSAAHPGSDHIRSVIGNGETCYQDNYREIVRVLKARGVSFEEPILLMPPPPVDCGLQDSPYCLASVDAIVLHPPDQSVAPAGRTVLFPDGMQRIAGRWTTDVWPVVVSAYQQHEPINAIPLDQVMLRQNETDFVLWIPAGAEYEIRVFNHRGLIESHVEPHAGAFSTALRLGCSQAEAGRRNGRRKALGLDWGGAAFSDGGVAAAG